jgi:hypothetical protein
MCADCLDGLSGHTAPTTVPDGVTYELDEPAGKWVPWGSGPYCGPRPEPIMPGVERLPADPDDPPLRPGIYRMQSGRYVAIEWEDGKLILKGRDLSPVSLDSGEGDRAA